MPAALIAVPAKSSWTGRRVDSVASIDQFVADLAAIITAGDPAPREDDVAVDVTTPRQQRIDRLSEVGWRWITPTQTGKAVRGSKAHRGIGLAHAKGDEADAKFGPNNSGDAVVMAYCTPKSIAIYARINGDWKRVAIGDYQRVAEVVAAKADDLTI